MNDVYPAPAPLSFTYAPPSASGLFESTFMGATSNGNWLLYIHDNGGAGGCGGELRLVYQYHAGDRGSHHDNVDVLSHSAGGTGDRGHLHGDRVGRSHCQ